MLAFVREQLARAVQHVAALGPDAVDVVADFGEPAVLEGADLILHELLETVSGQLFVFDVIGFVLLYENRHRK